MKKKNILSRCLSQDWISLSLADETGSWVHKNLYGTKASGFSLIRKLMRRKMTTAEVQRGAYHEFGNSILMESSACSTLVKLMFAHNLLTSLGNILGGCEDLIQILNDGSTKYFKVCNQPDQVFCLPSSHFSCYHSRVGWLRTNANPGSVLRHKACNLTESTKCFISTLLKSLWIASAMHLLLFIWPEVSSLGEDMS